MKLAIQKAKQFGIGCVLVKNAGHLGGAGYHASMAAKQGCIGQVLVYLHPITNSAFQKYLVRNISEVWIFTVQCFGAPGGGLMCPTFGAEPRFGTHPLAWAAPGGKEEADFLLDVATTQVSYSTSQKQTILRIQWREVENIVKYVLKTR